MAFELPVIKFLDKLVRENFPDFDIREGTAFRDMLIKPTALIVQPFRDQINIVKRNLSLSNFDLMLEDELDSLLANVFVDRKNGSTSTGSVRVFFSSPRDVTIDQNAKFLTESQITFVPTTSTSITAEEMRLNTEGTLFFVDVSVESEDPTDDANVDSNTVAFVSGAPVGVVRVTNPAAFSGGRDPESNNEVAARAKSSISTRDLVTKRSISAILLEQFDNIRELQVIGFRDDEMERDVVSIALDFLETVTGRTNGETTASTGTFRDTSANFFVDGILPGAELEIKSGADAGQFKVLTVSTDTLVVTPAFTTTDTGLSYDIRGIAVTDDFHIGGKVDIYLDTTTLAENTIVITPAPEVIPVTSTTQTFYENDNSFILPNLGIKRIVPIDPVTRAELGDPLIEGSEFRINVNDSKTRFSAIEDIEIQLLITDPLNSRFFIGSTLQVEYFCDPTITVVQDFVESDLDRVVTAGILIKHALPAFVDTAFTFSLVEDSETEASEIEDVVEEFINTIKFNEALEVSDLTTTVYFFNVNRIDLSSVIISIDQRDVDGTINLTTTSDTASIPRTAHFVSRNVTLTQV